MRLVLCVNPDQRCRIVGRRRVVAAPGHVHNPVVRHAVCPAEFDAAPLHTFVSQIDLFDRTRQSRVRHEIEEDVPHALWAARLECGQDLLLVAGHPVRQS